MPHVSHAFGEFSLTCLFDVINGKRFFFLFIYLFFLVWLQFLSYILLHCCRTITSLYNIKYKYCHTTILTGAGKKKKNVSR